MKAKVSPRRIKPIPMSPKHRRRAARWHVQQMKDLVEDHGKRILSAWIQLNELMEVKRQLRLHLEEFERMTKGAPTCK